MCRRDQWHPDPQMSAQNHPQSAYDDERLGELSATFVDMGGVYGTRMQTVVLVDHSDNVTFVERSRVPPSATGGESSDQWVWDPVKKFEFGIKKK